MLFSAGFCSLLHWNKGLGIGSFIFELNFYDKNLWNCCQSSNTARSRCTFWTHTYFVQMLVQNFLMCVINLHLKWSFNPMIFWLVKLVLRCHDLLLSLEIWGKPVHSVWVTRSCFTTFQLCKYLSTCYFDSYTKSINIKVHCFGCCLWHLNSHFLFPWFIRKQNIGENKPLASQKMAFLASILSMPRGSFISLFLHQR